MADQPSYETLAAALRREREARALAEGLLEDKSRDLYRANTELQDQQDKLQLIVEEKTLALQAKVAELEAMRDTLREDRDIARAESEAKTLFFAKLSHEIRTPLNGITGTLNLLADEPLNGESARLLALAGQSSAALRKLLNDVIDLAKLEQGLSSLEEGPVDLGHLLTDICDFWWATGLGERQSLSLTIDPALKHRVIGDAGRIRQVVDNFLSNAVKYAGAGEIRLALAVKPAEASYAIDISVTDTGKPLAQSAAEALFEPYNRGGQTSDRGVGSGAGLGLAICREVAGLMGGDVKCEPQNDGNCFRVALNLKSADQLADKPSAIENGRSDLRLQKNVKPRVRGHVLVVEDVPTNQLVLGRYLEKLGCRVAFAANGVEALELARERVFDLVLMDIAMPEMDGYAATRALRQIEAYKTVPIIAVSAHTDTNHLSAVREAGMDDSLPKPIDRAALEDRIFTLLGMQQPSGPPPPSPAINTEGVPEDLKAIMVEDIRAALEDLIEAREGNDLEGANNALHKLKSITGAFGFPVFHDVEAVYRDLTSMEDPRLPVLIADLRQLLA